MKKETAITLGIIGFLIGFIYVIFLITLNELKDSRGDNFSCKYWNENKTECFCGNTFDNGVYEYMWIGKVIGENVGGDMCCPEITNECWSIE